MSPRQPDEDDVRVRRRPPDRRRTRDQPRHDDAVAATVIAVDRGRFSCMLDGREVTAMRAGPLRHTPVVVGDRISLVGDTAGGVDRLARIVRVAERRSVLRRTADDTDPIERVLVANADQLVIVTSLDSPPPRPRLIDRCLVAAYDGGLDPLLCLTKYDLVAGRPHSSRDQLLAHYAPLDVAMALVSKQDEQGFAHLQEVLADRTSVMVGHSGVGKSTLVNRLVPGAARAIGRVSAIGKGRHTSSSAVALPLPGGGWIIDTPGIRSFGLGHVTPASLLAAFPDLAEAATDCPPHCLHGVADAGCGIAAAADTGAVAPARWESFRRLLAAPAVAESDD